MKEISERKSYVPISVRCESYGQASRLAAVRHDGLDFRQKDPIPPRPSGCESGLGGKLDNVNLKRAVVRDKREESKWH
jgi:hypothetical protein